MKKNLLLIQMMLLGVILIAGQGCENRRTRAALNSNGLNATNSALATGPAAARPQLTQPQVTAPITPVVQAPQPSPCGLGKCCKTKRCCNGCKEKKPEVATKEVKEAEIPDPIIVYKDQPPEEAFTLNDGTLVPKRCVQENTDWVGSNPRKLRLITNHDIDENGRLYLVDADFGATGAVESHKDTKFIAADCSVVYSLKGVRAVRFANFEGQVEKWTMDGKDGNNKGFLVKFDPVKVIAEQDNKLLFGVDEVAKWVPVEVIEAREAAPLPVQNNTVVAKDIAAKQRELETKLGHVGNAHFAKGKWQITYFSSCDPDIAKRDRVKKNTPCQEGGGLFAMREELIKHFRELKENRLTGTLVIEGHTDTTPIKITNEVLSLNRANAIKDYFLQKGVIDSRDIQPVGYGAQRLMYPEKDGARELTVAQLEEFRNFTKADFDNKKIIKGEGPNILPITSEKGGDQRAHNRRVEYRLSFEAVKDAK